MSSVRRRLSWVIGAWLLCQVAGVAAAPVAFCCQNVAAAADDEEECCPGLLPGQVCPMHHAKEGERTCKMRNAGAHTDAALLSLSGGIGVLPDATAVAIAFERDGASHVSRPSAIARAHRPESPPPRA